MTLSFLMTNSIKCPYSEDIQEQVSCLQTLNLPYFGNHHIDQTKVDV